MSNLADSLNLSVTLDDKYTLDYGRALMSGTQALVRLPMLQKQRDERAGLSTAGFISGYRGSPLGGVDQALWKAKAHLKKHNIVFQPGLNEDLAATSIWGSQQLNLPYSNQSHGAARQTKVDGVFAMWYGKGPGVDRSGDVFKHANAAGSAKHGGVLVLAGDDHGAKSSSLPHQSDHIFKACGLPVFYPATVQEYLDLGLHGWAMSRYSGLWMAMKTVTEVVEASSRVEIDSDRVKIITPDDFEMPADGLNIRWPDSPLAQEARLLDHKFYAALAYVRANKLNHTVINSRNAWFGIITAGKAYLDTRQALLELGLDEAACEQIGIRLYKCAVVWPLEAQGAGEFASGLKEILVVEEKRQIIEYALKEELYHWPDAQRPKIYGKFDEKDGRGGEWAMPMGQWLLPAHNELSPALIAKAIAARLLNPGHHQSRFALTRDMRQRIEDRIAIITAKEQAYISATTVIERTPTFCAGCPHNTSTHVPEGSRAVAGIGCHYMSTWMPERHTETFTQMGGEGTTWIGQAPFTNEPHIFANLGDGTYFHSGILAIRASIAAGVNITYKILYNDAVAMTGGQPIDGTLTVPQIVAQMRAERASKIVIVTDEPEKYQGVAEIASTQVFHRDHLESVQKDLREISGCSILIYDQTCASEKRRRRKKIVDGKPAFPDPPKRFVINAAVCEGCGDCSVQSSCVAIEPLETELGRKRQINQSACNKDYSCAKGFCPSFVAVEGGQLRKGQALDTAPAIDWLEEAKKLMPPNKLSLGVSGNSTYGILVTGIGGSGVVTIGQLLGMAAHIEGKGVTVLDMAGLAQKGGAVYSHIQLAARPEQLFSTRIATGEADLIIGCDLVVASGHEALSKMRPSVTRGVFNDAVQATSEFIRNRDATIPQQALKHNIATAAGEQELDFFDATAIATRHMGDALYTNPLLMGYAWQKGWIPLTLDAIVKAIELNAISVKANIEAFAIGRLTASKSALITASPSNTHVIEFKRHPAKEVSFEDTLAFRKQELTLYQNTAYADRYTTQVLALRAYEKDHGLEHTLSQTVAHNLFKLMAYKDEYEVARLMSTPQFRKSIEAQFTGDYKLAFFLSPPLISRVDPKTGRPKKIRFGAWMGLGFKMLQHFKRLRQTPFDVFGYTAERHQERLLLARYCQWLGSLRGTLNAANYSQAIAIAQLPASIRGFGPVKEKAIEKTTLLWDELLDKWKDR
jgi:indolepyruvate ferredoxin oxidoreductase